MNRRQFIQHTGILAAATTVAGTGSLAYPSRFTDQKGQDLLSEARKNIEQVRKANLQLKVETSASKPASGWSLELQQLESDFDWGSSSALSLTNDKDPELQEKISRQFRQVYNCTTAKCYWDERWHQPIEHEEGHRITRLFESEVHWALINGLRVKGHPLVWTVRKAIPRWLDKYPVSRQMQILEQHVRSLIRTGGKQVTRWDLCNEMLWEPSLRNLPQRNWPHLETSEEILSYLEPAVHWARDENPQAIYSLNDYGLVRTTENVKPVTNAEKQRQRYLDLLEEMYRRGCLPDAVGVQAHIGGWFTPSEFQTALDHLAEAGLPVQVTEFWAHPKENPLLEGKSVEETESARAQYVGDMATLAFGHPAVSHFTYWGNGGIDHDTGETLPYYHRMEKLIRREWMTRASLQLDHQGSLETRVFTGKYLLKLQDPRKNIHKFYFDVSKSAENKISLTVLPEII